jgi:hypothetical protein
MYVVLACAVALYDAVLFFLGHVPGERFQVLWALVCLALIIAWVELDCRERGDVYRPFEFGFLLLLFWPLYLPYYLFRTRGGALAAFWLVSAIGLFYLGYALQWVIYAVRVR